MIMLTSESSIASPTGISSPGFEPLLGLLHEPGSKGIDLRGKVVQPGRVKDHAAEHRSSMLEDTEGRLRVADRFREHRDGEGLDSEARKHLVQVRPDCVLHHTHHVDQPSSRGLVRACHDAIDVPGVGSLPTAVFPIRDEHVVVSRSGLKGRHEIERREAFTRLDGESMGLSLTEPESRMGVTATH